MTDKKVTSLADHRRQLSEDKVTAALRKFFAMGGTRERAEQIIEAAFAAESPEALKAAIDKMQLED